MAGIKTTVLFISCTVCELCLAIEWKMPPELDDCDFAFLLLNIVFLLLCVAAVAHDESELK